MAAQAPLPQASVRPGPALEHAQAQDSGLDHLREADIGALGEHRVALEPRAQPRDVERRDVGTKNTACGLPMLTAAGRGRPATSIGTASVSQGSGQRDRRQSQLGLAHVTAIRPSGQALGPSRRSPTAIAIRLAGALLEQQPRDAARAVAAGPGLAAVGVEEAQADVGVPAPARSARAGRTRRPMPVADPADWPRRPARRRARPSSTTKSLPQLPVR